MTTWRILNGDVREMLATLPAQSVQTCVTSPPYWGLRDYGHAGQLGLEATPEAYVSAMVEVFREVRRVLKDDGTVWLNLGDSYAAQRGGTQVPAETLAGGRGGHAQEGRGDRGRGSLARVDAMDYPAGVSNKARVANRDAAAIGLKHKDLVGIPWMVAFALRADGWYLRSDIIWSKPNPMPESVTDRPTKAHEYIFLLSKSARYYYDAESIQEPSVRPGDVQTFGGDKARTNIIPAEDPRFRNGAEQWGRTITTATTRNKRSVWTVTTQPYPEAHFATYPEKLIEPCILAGSREGDTVLDPFGGSGTTAAVSVRLQRHAVICELNPAYVELARTRIGNVAPLLAREVA